MTDWQRTVVDQLSAAAMRGAAGGRDMRFVNNTLECFREHCQRYDNLLTALDSIVKSGLIGGHDHPVDICKCAQCGIRRLIIKCKEAEK